MREILVVVATLLPAAPEDAITSISLVRTPCFGTCPVDEVVLRPDGSAEYTGTRHVDRLGHYAGTAEPGAFEALAALLEEKGFFDLDAEYRAPITDQATLITRATRGGATKEVRDYGRAAPKEMLEIEKAIIALIDAIDWEPAPEPPPREAP